MDLTPDQISQIEAVLIQLEDVDPAALPEPAALLVSLLSEILESTETP